VNSIDCAMEKFITKIVLNKKVSNVFFMMFRFNCLVLKITGFVILIFLLVFDR
jgi:hypothetical protein